MMIMGWVAMLVAIGIAGMGGAPIAEYFGQIWLMHTLKWIAWIAIALLSVATLIIGGLGLYHGILTIMGKSPGTVTAPMAAAPLPSVPQVEDPDGGHVA